MTLIAAITLSGILLALAALPNSSVTLVVARAASSGPTNGIAVAIGIVLGDLFFCRFCGSWSVRCSGSARRFFRSGENRWRALSNMARYLATDFERSSFSSVAQCTSVEKLSRQRYFWFRCNAWRRKSRSLLCKPIAGVH